MREIETLPDADDAEGALRLLALVGDLTDDMGDFAAHAMTCALIEDLCRRWDLPTWAWLKDRHSRFGGRVH